MRLIILGIDSAISRAGAWVRPRLGYIPALIYLASLAFALEVSLNMPIISDTMREYQVYITFLNHDSPLWRPLTDSMLSTAIFTTYLPAVIQRVLGLADPQIVFRVVLALAVATAPMALYMAARRYTGVVIALLLVLVFATSFYFLNNAIVARMVIATAWAAYLLSEIDTERPRRWLYLVFPVIGLLTGHYTAALLWLGVLVIATLLMGAAQIATRTRIPQYKPLAMATGYLGLGAAIYYGVIATRARVWNYAAHGINRVIDRFGWQLPPRVAAGIVEFGPNGHDPAHLVDLAAEIPPPPGPVRNTAPPYNVEMPERFTAPPYNVDIPEKYGPVDEGRVWNHEAPELNANPLKNERLDFVLGEVMIMFRAVLAVVLVTRLVRRGDWTNPLVYIYIAGTALSLLGIWLPSIAAMLGSLRIGFLMLIVDLLAIALWYREGRGARPIMYPVLLLMLYMYH